MLETTTEQRVLKEELVNPLRETPAHIGTSCGCSGRITIRYATRSSCWTSTSDTFLDNAKILVDQIQLTTGNAIGVCKACITTMESPQMQLSRIIFIASKLLHK